MKNLRIAWTVCGFKSYSSEHFQAGEADDYEIICKDGSFGIHEHCLFNSEFLYKQHKARQNFDGKGKETKTFVEKSCCMTQALCSIVYACLRSRESLCHQSPVKKIENSI